VRLQVRATKDGRVEVEKVRSGSPTLADAAMRLNNGGCDVFEAGAGPVDVISTVTLNFLLHSGSERRASRQRVSF